MSAIHRNNRSHWPLVVLSLIPGVLGVLLPLILVRMVSPAEVGLFKVFFLYLGIAPAILLTSGVKSGLAYWAGQESKGPHAMAVSSSLLLLIGLLGAIIALSFTNVIAMKLSIPQQDTYLFALSLFGAIAGCYFEEAAIALGMVWRGALFYCGFEVLRTVAIVSALFLYRSVSAVLIAHTVISTVKLIAGYWYGYQIGIVGFALSRELLKDVWRYAVPVSIAYLFGIFIGSADQFILAHQVTPSEFALYSIGCLSIAPLFTFEQSVTRVLIPQMSEAFSKQQPERAAALYRSAVDILGFILFPAVTGLAVFASPIIDLFFTARYTEGAKYLQIFGLSYLLLIIPHDALARSRGEAAWILRTFIIFSITSFLLSYLLIPVAGPVGAICGVLLSGAAMRLYAIHYFRSKLSLRFRDFLPLRRSLQYASICLVAGTMAFSSRPLFPSPRYWLFGAGALFSVSYLALALPVKNRAERRRERHPGVLLLSQSLNIGGLERMILNLSQHLLAENRWQVRVLAYDHLEEKPGLIAEFRQSHIPVEVFRKRAGFSFRVVGKILKTIHQNEISVIHSQDLGTLIYAVLAKVCALGRVSIVHTQHSFPTHEETLRYRIYRYLFSQGIDELGAVSDDVRGAYSRLGVRKARIHLIENGVDFPSQPSLCRHEKIAVRNAVLQTLPADQQRDIQPLMDNLWILYQARFSPGKGQDNALRLWREMGTSERGRAILCFVGPESADGEYDRIRSLMEGCPSSERIFILGASTTPREWLKAADVFLSCSEYEGMPLAPLEAAGAGLPLLLSEIPGHSFLQGVGLLFPLDDIRQGASQSSIILHRIISEGEQYQRELWENSRHIRERFSVAQMAQRYSALYGMSIR